LKCSHINQNKITNENIQQWLSDLTTLARVAESLPPPTQTAEASALERNTRVDRNRLILPVLGIIFAIVVVVGVCGLIPVVVTLLSNGR